MNNSQTVYLSSLNPYVSGFAPFTLTINPSGITTSSKIYKIVYNFGDEKIETSTLGIDISGNNISPLSKTISNLYAVTDSFNKTFDVNIDVYTIGNLNYDRYSFELNLLSGELESLNTLTSANNSYYFKEMHLVGSRMFGVNDNIVYIFESINPNHLLPVMVNWKERPEVPFIPFVGNTYRPYKLLMPFENEIVTSAKTITNIINCSIRESYAPLDDGGIEYII
jgi:hypothetical protein